MQRTVMAVNSKQQAKNADPEKVGDMQRNQWGCSLSFSIGGVESLIGCGALVHALIS